MTPHYLVNGHRLSSEDPEWQQVLATAHASGTKPLCLCRPAGTPVYIARYEQFVVKRLPESGHLHHPRCSSYEQAPALSGLGELMGDAIIERTSDCMDVHLDFPLTRRVGRRAVVGDASTTKSEVTATRRRLGLRGLVQLLLHRAGFNRWSPRMQGKRTWFVVRKHLIAVAREIQTRGVRLADLLLLPEPFSLDDAAALAGRRSQLLAMLLARHGDTEIRLMLVLGELKAFSATDVDYRIVLKHMPDCALYMERKAAERFKKTFEREYEAWAHQRCAEQDSQADPWRLRFLFCGLIYAKREGLYFVDTATLLLLSSTWIPLDQPNEQLLVDELVRQQRRFLKPLRFDSRQGPTFPNAVLLDTGDAETPLDILSPFMSETDRSMKTVAIARRRPPGWVWDISRDAELPALPAPSAEPTTS